MARFAITLTVFAAILIAGLWLLPGRPPPTLPTGGKVVIDMPAHVAAPGQGCDDCFAASRGGTIPGPRPEN